MDQLSSFYENKYILVSSIVAESTQEFMDKVYELADENGLSSDAFKSMLLEFSVNKIRGDLNKVL